MVTMGPKEHIKVAQKAKPGVKSHPTEISIKQDLSKDLKGNLNITENE